MNWPADLGPRLDTVETGLDDLRETWLDFDETIGAPRGVATLDGDGHLHPDQRPPGSGGGGVSEWHDVTDYGATGDGETDDTDAIQSALSAVREAGGGTVWVPGGTYAIASGPIRIYARTRLTLAPDAVMLRTASGTMLLNGDADQDFGEYSGHGDLIIEGGVWDANGVEVQQNNMVLSLGHTERVTVHDTLIKDVPGSTRSSTTRSVRAGSSTSRAAGWSTRPATGRSPKRSRSTLPRDEACSAGSARMTGPSVTTS